MDYYTATSLAKDMAHSLLDSLKHFHVESPSEDSLDPQLGSASILGLANDIQTILGEAMVAASTIFPHKPHVSPTRGTLP